MFHRFFLFALFSPAFALKSPVLIWSPSRTLSDFPQSHTGQTLNPEDFHQSYLKPLTKDKNLVVFIQDRLSLQDLNHHADVYNPYSDGGAFKNIKSFMEDQFSVQIPSVMSPWSSLEKMMTDFKGKVHQVLESTDLNNLDLGGTSNLIIVTLTPVQGSKDDGKVFQDNDQKMAEVTKQLTKRGVDFTALYTGKTAVKESDVQSGMSRSLKSVPSGSNTNYTFLNITCPDRTPFFLFMRSLDLTIEVKGSIVNATNVTLENQGTTCTNDTVMLKLKGSGPDITSLQLDWTIILSNHTEYYNITENSVLIDYKNNSQSQTANETLVLDALTAPKDFSYHCSLFRILTKKVNETANITLIFDGLQIQPFNVMGDQFSDGWDCVYFFTEGIWMAIISTLVFTLIILYGLSMIASLTTMDRYDDPKGKTITVNVNE